MRVNEAEEDPPQEVYEYVRCSFTPYILIHLQIPPWKNTSGTPPTGLRGPTGIFFAVPQTSTPPSSLPLLSVTKSNKAGPLVPVGPK
ncbi:hypothetical protein LENED_005704 [Lentinula edodes]|uniref:Uncharacterized protein n=1 Tax=Lentinula edodes TaxID=5353 RepID=A0A1Q3E9Q4_LENED|nr:hypothetical protein LENED_005704 [Lentinula edodes]